MGVDFRDLGQSLVPTPPAIIEMCRSSGSASVIAGPSSFDTELAVNRGLVRIYFAINNVGDVDGATGSLDSKSPYTIAMAIRPSAMPTSGVALPSTHSLSSSTSSAVIFLSVSLKGKS